jgi:hypothetical protein
VAGSCEYGDEPSGSAASELVIKPTMLSDSEWLSCQIIKLSSFENHLLACEMAQS